MPEPSQAALMGLAPIDDLDDSQHVANLSEGASRYEAAAEVGISGIGASGWVKAGDTWTRLGETEKAAAAYENAADTTGIVGFAARNSLAKQAEAAGDIEGAAAQWAAVAKTDQGYLAQVALVSTTKAWERAGETDKATAAAQEFLVRFPNSQMAGELSDYAPAPTTVETPEGEGT